jgi:hypothetical protein
MANILDIIVRLKDEASKEAEKLKGNLEGLNKTGESFKSWGTKFTLGVTLPVVGGAVASTLAASDTEESLSKVLNVYGDLGPAAVESATKSTTAWGISRQEALAALGLFGDMYQAQGLSTEAALDYSQATVQMAADWASFHNSDPAEVLDSIQAAVTGSYMPMKKYGIVLNAFNVESMAMAMTGKEAAKELTEAELVAARFALIQEKGARATGDFARTSDGLANQTRILKAEMANMTAELGTHFLPFATQLVGWLVQGVNWFQALSPEIQKGAVVFGLIAAAIGPLLWVIGTLITSITAVIPVATAIGAVLSGPVLLAVGAVIAIIIALTLAWNNNWGDIQGKTEAVTTFIQHAIHNFIRFIRILWVRHGQELTQVATDAWTTISNTVTNLTAAINRIVSGLVTVLTGLFERNRDTLTKTTENTWALIEGTIKRVKAIISALVAALVAALTGDWYKFGQELRKAWDNVWGLIGDILKTAKANIQLTVKALIDEVIRFFKTTDWGQLGRDIIAGIVNGLKSRGQNIKDALVGLVSNAWEAVKGFLGIKSPSTKFAFLGRESMAGFIEGVKGMSSGVETAAVQGAGAQTQTISTTFYVTANYAPQTFRSLKTDVKMLNALYGGGRGL